jgi:hypothetical protein
LRSSLEYLSCDEIYSLFIYQTVRVRYVGEFPVIAGGLLWTPNEVKDVDERTAHELFTNPNFVRVNVKNTEKTEGESR